jgi:5-methyltetrahydrofolate--homocysteine methyltransferase
MAIAAGLDSAIINPTDETIMDAYHSSLVLINRDKRAESYINRFGKRVKEPIEEAKEILEEKPKEIRERLAQAVVEGDEENIVPLVEEAICQGLDPIQISN